MFPQTMQFSIFGVDVPPQYTPPPQSAEFPAIVQFLNVGEDSEPHTTPPPAGV
jgi:hypothetical protein